MVAEQPIAIGLDMGTGGARAIAMDLAGAVVATGRADLSPGAARTEGACVEQDPRAWTDAARSAIRQVVAGLPTGSSVVGVSVDATSGTFLLADAEGTPITPGLMYNDLRAAEQAPRAAEVIDETLRPYGISIAAAFALPKILHLAETQPQVFARCRRVIHQTDWIVGMLCGRYDVTDISTALKTGADPGRLAWPEAIEKKLGVPLERLPMVVLPGTRIGEVTAAAAAQTGLPAGTPVFAGCTDGTAGALASGASTSGDLNVTLGTTLVFKAVADAPLIDSSGAIYNHRHPAGGYLPGAASSTGGEWVSALTGTAGLNTLGRQAAALIPTRHLAYPLVKKGERFPFASPQATGFGLDEIESLPERFAAGMEGVAYLERLSIDRFAELGLRIGDTISATGGGAYGETWLRIRASVAQRKYAVPEQPECVVGAAILAAAAHAGGVGQAIRSMVRIGRRFEPDPVLVPAYEDGCRRFRDELRRRGWM
jgi:D-ribulokinase